MYNSLKMLTESVLKNSQTLHEKKRANYNIINKKEVKTQNVFTFVSKLLGTFFFPTCGASSILTLTAC